MKEDPCSPEDIAVKSYFLGPMGENFSWFQDLFHELLELWDKERWLVNESSGRAISETDQKTDPYSRERKKMIAQAKLLRSRLQSEVPIYSSKFMSHMVYESSIVGLLGHMITLLHNPNLISSEVSQQASFLEKEAISDLLEMVGYSAKGEGHFTSGGTVANIEALWRARFRMDHWLALGAMLDSQSSSARDSWFSWAHMGWQEYYKYIEQDIEESLLEETSFVLQNPFQLANKFSELYKKTYVGPVILVPGNKHYSWQKGASLLGYGMEAFWQVALDEMGRLDVHDLHVNIEKAKGEHRPILMVVSVAGTTEMGEFDPVDQVQNLLDQYQAEEGLFIWHHVDAAYGGFYASFLKGQRTSQDFSALEVNLQKSLEAFSRVDSITIDPHKLGYVPYSCGAILLPDENNYRTSSFHAPYIGESKEKWMRTLEGSRAATGAGATWLTAKTLGFHQNGIGRILQKGILARKRLQTLMRSMLPEARFLDNYDTNVFCFCVAHEGETLSQVNERTLRIFSDHYNQEGYFVSKTTLEVKSYGKYIKNLVGTWKGHIDVEKLVLIRLVFMNPFFVSKVQSQLIDQEFIQRLSQYIKK
ncbi:MAG: aspartate aminotransferase family protein [Bdellovibrionales bacterium]|nr:aspartate aminotransferase family protein [Bdellovibrionales bacterium]